MYLLVKLLYSYKGRTACDGIDEDEPFAVTDPLIPERRVLFLSCGIQDFKHTRLSVDNNLLSVRVFDGGVISFDKVIQTKLVDRLAAECWTVSKCFNEPD